MLIKNEEYRVNFIDSNDVFVGYDMSHDCCEWFGWFIAPGLVTEHDEVEKLSTETAPDVRGFVFDPTFGEQLSFDYEGSLAVFRLVNDSGAVLFLHLFNSHNGYYGHGFDSNTVLGDGVL